MAYARAYFSFSRQSYSLEDRMREWKAKVNSWEARMKEQPEILSEEHFNSTSLEDNKKALYNAYAERYDEWKDIYQLMTEFFLAFFNNCDDAPMSIANIENAKAEVATVLGHAHPYVVHSMSNADITEQALYFRTHGIMNPDYIEEKGFWSAIDNLWNVFLEDEYTPKKNVTRTGIFLMVYVYLRVPDATKTKSQLKSIKTKVASFAVNARNLIVRGFPPDMLTTGTAKQIHDMETIRNVDLQYFDLIKAIEKFAQVLRDSAPSINGEYAHRTMQNVSENSWNSAANVAKMLESLISAVTLNNGECISYVIKKIIAGTNKFLENGLKKLVTLPLELNASVTANQHKFYETSNNLTQACDNLLKAWKKLDNQCDAESVKVWLQLQIDMLNPRRVAGSS